MHGSPKLHKSCDQEIRQFFIYIWTGVYKKGINPLSLQVEFFYNLIVFLESISQNATVVEKIRFESWIVWKVDLPCSCQLLFKYSMIYCVFYFFIQNERYSNISEMSLSLVCYNTRMSTLYNHNIISNGRD